MFAAAMDALGITNDSTVVVYDTAGVFSAPRVWWTFRAFGHDQCASPNPLRCLGVSAPTVTLVRVRQQSP